jgi:hypothetical protein
MTNTSRFNLHVSRFTRSTLSWFFALCGLTACSAAHTSPPITEWYAFPSSELSTSITVEDARWRQATSAFFPLHEGSHGALTHEVVELRALYDTQRIAFRARWREAQWATETPLFTLFWRKDGLPEQRGECHTACHHAFGDNRGGLKLVIASVVPAGREEPMAAQAQWRDGLWTLVWSRPLISNEATDVQFNDLTQHYPVRAKVWRNQVAAPAWVSERYALRFRAFPKQASSTAFR